MNEMDIWHLQMMNLKKISNKLGFVERGTLPTRVKRGILDKLKNYDSD